jgi:hypothetical protein
MPHARRYPLVSANKPRTPECAQMGIERTRRKISSPAIATISSAATTAAPAPATAAPAAAATTTTAATPEAASTALRSLFSLIHSQRPSVESRAIHGLDRLLRLCRCPHRNETKAPRLARGSVRHDVYVRYFSNAREGFAHGFVGGRE